MADKEKTEFRQVNQFRTTSEQPQHVDVKLSHDDSERQRQRERDRERAFS